MDEAWFDVGICDHNGDRVDTAPCYDFVDALLLTDALNEELQRHEEALLVRGEEDVGVVPHEETELVQQQHGLTVLEVVHARQVVLLLLEEGGCVGGDGAIEVHDEVLTLREDVADHSEDHEAGVRNQDRLRLEEGVVLVLADRGIKNLGAGALKRQINRAASKVHNEGDGAIDVITHGFDEFAGLRLGNHRLLLVAAVERKINILLRIVLHLLCFLLGELDQVQADLDHDILHIGEENRAILLVTGRDR